MKLAESVAHIQPVLGVTMSLQIHAPSKPSKLRRMGFDKLRLLPLGLSVNILCLSDSLR
jgi:hypothetical protein